MEITVCNKSTPHGGSGCFNFIAHLVQPYADHCIVTTVDSDGSELNQVDSRSFFNHMIIHDVWCKIFTHEETFQDELKNIYVLKKIYGDDFEKNTTYREYDGFFGFKIEINGDNLLFELELANKHATPVIYVLLQCRCDSIKPKTSTSTPPDFEKLIKDTSPPLNLLHENGYMHVDIRPANIVSCNGEFKIIDYGMMKHKTELWFPSLFFKLERNRINNIESLFENHNRFWFLHRTLPMLGVVIAVGLCTWACHDLLIIKKKNKHMH
jgi:serine/threonine protein kinase